MKRNKYLLLGSSSAVLLLLLWAAVEENLLKEWRRIQAQGRNEQGPIAVQLRQVVNALLGVADRCTSCHVSMGPGEQDVYGSAVMHAHRPVVHDPAEYGCTICHGGQGQATEKRDAHGDVPFWPEPMLDKEMSQAGCGGCHVALGVPGARRLRAAALAFERLDCYACHRVDGRGGTLRPDGGGMEGPDLSRVGLVTWDPNWYTGHLIRRNQASSGLWKEAFRPVSAGDLALLDVFLATRMAAPKLVEAKGVFLSSGCLGCHKVSGVGGDDGPDLTLAGFKDPARVSFENVPGGGGLKNWMAEHFRSPVSVVAGSQMPPVALSDREIELLTLFTLSLRRKELRDVYLPKDRIRAVKLGEREFSGDGETLFGAFCSGCHGADGLGRRLPGTLSFPSVANPDFLAIAPEALLAKTVEQGRPGRRMPGWLKEGGLRPQEIRNVLGYIRTIGGVAAEPDTRPARWVRADAVQGGRIFDSACSGCHGKQGRGSEAPALDNKLLLESATDTYLVETIARGRRGTAMAGFLEPSPVRPALDRADIEAVVAYLRSLEGGRQ